MSEQNILPGAGLAEGIKGNAGLTIVSGVKYERRRDRWW